MPLNVNLRHLTRDSVRLKGELPVKELDLDIHDELVQFKEPLRHDIEVQLLEQNILAQGKLEITVDCECVRCLKSFRYKLKLPDWVCHLPLVGEDAAKVTDDSVDLTEYVREDILLAFPAHPVCKPDCAGLAGTESGSKKKRSPGAGKQKPSAWDALDKLKFRS